MTCATCGRENPPHLTFCQECGQRLGPRVAPPTPPIGLADDGALLLQHPVVLLQHPVVRAHPPPAPAPAAHGASERPCRICATPNGPNVRYCTSCGSTLEPTATPAAAAAAPHVLERGPTGPAPAPDHGAPIAPMRVVDLGGAGPTNEVRTCARCRGVVNASAQFCKFCGAALAEAAPPAVAPTLAPAAPPPIANGHPRPMAEIPIARPAPVPKPMHLDVTAPQPAAAVPVARSVTRGRLVVIAKSGADGPAYPFSDTLDIGRLEGHVVVGEDPYLSPRHVRIAWTGSKLVLQDLASTNGVYVRLVAARDRTTESANNARRGAPPNEPVAPSEVAVPLHDQDLILVGQQVLRFELVRDGDAGFGPAMEHGTLLFGSPAAPRYARLLQRTVEGITRDVYHVRKAETVLGRESGDIVFTEDPFLSRRHAAIRVVGRGAGDARQPPRTGESPSDRRDETSFALVDLGSSNGTFLRIRKELELVPGDHFRVGQQLFRIDFDPSRASPSPPPPPRAPRPVNG